MPEPNSALRRCRGAYARLYLCACKGTLHADQVIVTSCVSRGGECVADCTFMSRIERVFYKLTRALPSLKDKIRASFLTVIPLISRRNLPKLPSGDHQGVCDHVQKHHNTPPEQAFAKYYKHSAQCAVRLPPQSFCRAFFCSIHGRASFPFPPYLTRKCWASTMLIQRPCRIKRLCKDLHHMLCQTNKDSEK